MNAIAAADRLNVRLGGQPLSEEQLGNLRMWAAGIFRVVVIGEIKKGKSSFINALLGARELVPTSSEVATSTMYKIHYTAEKKYRVFFRPESGKTPLNIVEADLPLFGTERGNPGNEKQVAFIEVGVPSPLLKAGVVIFDTPGLGGLLAEHRRVTYECLPKADAVFFVCDAVESAIGKLETEYLQDVRRFTEHIVTVQTKSCAVDRSAREARRKNNLRILAECLGKAADQIPYFTVDSSLRFEAEEYRDQDDLAASGYPALLAFMQKELLPRKREILRRRIIAALTPLMQRINESLAARQTMLDADSGEKIAQLRKETEAKQQELTEWNTVQRVEMMQHLRTELSTLRNEAVDLCDANKPNGELHQKCNAMVNAAADINEVRRIMEQMQVSLPDAASGCMQEISKRLTASANEILARMSITETQFPPGHRAASPTTVAISTTPMADAAQSMGAMKNNFDDLRTKVYGGLAGMTIASLAGGIIGSVVPVIGSVVGSWLGMAVAGIWGGVEAASFKKTQELRIAKQQALHAITQQIAALHTEMTKQVHRVIQKIQEQVERTLSDFAREREQSLKTEVQRLSERGKLQQKELEERRRELGADRREWQAICRVLGEPAPQATNK